jgi:hypothetical protein
MIRLLWAIIAALFSGFRSQGGLMIENLALRQQLSTVLQKRRPRIGPVARPFWVVLRCVGKMVRCGRHREARDGDRVAPSGLRPLLEAALQAEKVTRCA